MTQKVFTVSYSEDGTILSLDPSYVLQAGELSIEITSLPIDFDFKRYSVENGNVISNPVYTIAPLIARIDQAYIAGMFNIKDWWSDNLLDSESYGKEAVEATRKWLFHTAAHCFNILNDEVPLLAGRDGKENAIAHLEAQATALGVRDYWKLVIENDTAVAYYVSLSVDAGTHISTDAFVGVVPTEPTGIKSIQDGSFISPNFNPI